MHRCKPILVALFVLVCAVNAINPASAREFSDKKIDFLYSIESFADFRSIQGAPLSDKWNDVWSVKLVYDMREGVLYFVNSLRYRYHYEFCESVLGDNTPLYEYNSRNYGNSIDRLYILASLNYYVSSHTYCIEFTSEDRINDKQLAGFCQKVKKQACMGDSIKLLVNTDYLLTFDKQGTINFPKVYAGEIYKSQKYQMLNPGVAYGVLRKQNSGGEGTMSENDIVIVSGTPISVPVCAGLITNSFQTPLSHINILCHNRDIPSAANVNIFNDADANKCLNQPVRLEVSQSGMRITAATKGEVDSFMSHKKRVEQVQLRYDLSVKDLLPVKDFGLKQKDIIGNKAAGLGELNKVAQKMNSKFSIPEGAFAIPFYYYQQHISTPAVRSKIEALEKLQSNNASEEKISKQLKQVRDAIKEHPLDPQLLEEVTQMIKANGKWPAYRFRSSSNAEDAAGFSAAGLYESKTGKLDDKDKPIDMAIKKVWASTFTEAAYRERRACHIEEASIMMGILVHRSFPDEAANGVAVTSNLSRAGFPGYTVNVQIGEVPVVSPPDTVICEQFICMDAGAIDPTNHDVIIDYITSSNLTGNKPVLTKKQVTQLYDALTAVRSHYYAINAATLEPNQEIVLDIEFKFDNNGKLYLKQARPYR